MPVYFFLANKYIEKPIPDSAIKNHTGNNITFGGLSHARNDVTYDSRSIISNIKIEIVTFFMLDLQFLFVFTQPHKADSFYCNIN